MVMSGGSANLNNIFLGRLRPIAQSMAHLTEEPEVTGLMRGPATYFRKKNDHEIFSTGIFSFRIFKKPLLVTCGSLGTRTLYWSTV